MKKAALTETEILAASILMNRRTNKVVSNALKTIQTTKGDKGDPGEKGDQGLPGIQGEKGEKGDPGKDGRPGIQGLKGDKGDPGEKGDQGIPGIQGEKGDQGLPGIQGEQGIPGERGPKGDKGDQGERGEKGDQGIPGERGPKGDKGTPGIKGEPGVKGDKGDIGPRGPRGEKGEPGKDGAHGLDGRVGERGKKGDKGDKGDPGPKGDRGEKGDKGDPGKDAEAFDPTPIINDLEAKFNLYKRQVSTSVDSAISRLSKVAGGGSHGGGSVNILDNDDVVYARLQDVEDNSVLIFDASLKKFRAMSIVDIINNITTGLEMKYTKLIDKVGSLTYIGEAEPGTATSAATWRISRVDETNDPDLTILWADGVSTFTKTWDDRATYSYS